jgi:Tfp pilus assembly protein PilF
MSNLLLLLLRPALALILFIATGTAHPAVADTVEVAPGVQVTKRTYAAPIEEQPFYGFAVKTEVQRDADDKFLKTLLEVVGTREKALDEIIKRGWRALGAGKVDEAAKRFNQAYLLAPEQSAVYHGFAAVTQIRFNDVDYAGELFRIALKQPNPLKVLNADYGRLLLIAKKPAQALPVLEQAIKDTPDFGDAWTNLAWARLQTGDRDGACAAVAEAMTRRPSSDAATDLNNLRNGAQCK